MIALMFVLSVLTCIDAGAVPANGPEQAASCFLRCPTLRDCFPMCRITEGIARLLLEPRRTIKLIKEVMADLINSFSLKQLMEATIGAVTVPIYLIIHSPEEIKFAIVGIDRYVIPAFKRELKNVEDRLRERPLETIKRVLSSAALVPIYTVFEGMEGAVVALSQSGGPNYYEAFLHVRRMGLELFHIIYGLIWNFHCTNILSPSSCNKLHHVFENIVVNPAFNFVNGLMALVQKVLDKIKEVVLPIVDRLSPSKLQVYCSMVISEENCARIFLRIREMDKFGLEEKGKVLDLVNHVIQWVIKHIFTDNVLSKGKLTKVINNF